jgi:hypothetical protein
VPTVLLSADIRTSDPAQPQRRMWFDVLLARRRVCRGFSRQAGAGRTVFDPVLSGDA